MVSEPKELVIHGRQSKALQDKGAKNLQLPGGSCQGEPGFPSNLRQTSLILAVTWHLCVCLKLPGSDGGRKINSL